MYKENPNYQSEDRKEQLQQTNKTKQNKKTEDGKK